MTRIDLEALQRELSSTEQPVPVGEIVLQAVDAHGPDDDIRGKSVIFSELSRIKITAGEPGRMIDLIPTDGTFCWRIEIAKLRPKQVVELHVLVPVSSTPIPIGDLPRVDPRTLQPSPEAEAVWEAVARLATEASNEARVAAEEAVAAAASIEGDVEAAASSATAAAESADAAAGSASQASTSATSAGNSAAAAGTSASNAAISASDADAAALAAQSSAATASSQANIATSAAQDAAGSAGSADTSAGAASASAGTAAVDATRAETARTGAESARAAADQRATDAGTARDGAVAARSGAETARDQAQAVAASKGQPNGIGSLDASGKQPEAQVPDRLASTALAAAFVSLKAAAKNPDLLVVGNITRDANQAVTSADVVWPDGTPGTFTAETLSSAFPGAVDGYRITYGSPVTKTFTQPAITRNSAGAATTVPQIVVS